MKHMNKILWLVLFSLPAMGQQLTYPMPMDARNNPIPSGIGLPYATTLTPTTGSYSASIQYQVPVSGIDVNRAYRHILVKNPSTTRTAYICFGSASACSTDHIIIPTETQLVLDSIRFGNAVGFPYVWARLDAGGSSALNVIVW